MTRALRYDSYDAPTGRAELLAHIGPDGAPRRILIVPPLFDEHSRLRRTLMLTMRALALRGIGSALLDLPGQNESETALEEVRLADWRASAAAAAGHIRATHVASLRGGALVDDAARLPLWRFAPTAGAKLMTTMLRAQIAADKQAGLIRTREDYWAMAQSRPILLGGKIFSPGLVADLRAAEPASCDATVADGSLGPPLWLRTEPGESAELAGAMAAALDAWSGATP